MTIADVSQFTGLSWDTVKDIDKSYLRQKYQAVSLAAVRYIAIDEVYLGRKRKFVTIVMDLEIAAVRWPRIILAVSSQNSLRRYVVALCRSRCGCQ
jgi:hypothetical protein